MNQLDTKQRIFNVAARLFSEKGYPDTSIRDIAEEVGIKGASIYNHYTSKDDILNDILNYYEERTYFYQRELNELDLSAIPVEEYPARMHYSYKPDEMLLMFWAGRIVVNEQHRNPRAAELLLGKPFEMYIRSYQRFFESVALKNLSNVKNCRIFAEIYARVSVTFMLQFQHQEMFDAKEVETQMSEMYKFIYALQEKTMNLDFSWRKKVPKTIKKIKEKTHERDTPR